MGWVNRSQKTVYIPSIVTSADHFFESIQAHCLKLGFSVVKGPQLQASGGTCWVVALTCLSHYLDSCTLPEVQEEGIVLPPELLMFAETTTTMWTTGAELWSKYHPDEGVLIRPSKEVFIIYDPSENLSEEYLRSQFETKSPVPFKGEIYKDEEVQTGVLSQRWKGGIHRSQLEKAIFSQPLTSLTPVDLLMCHHANLSMTRRILRYFSFEYNLKDVPKWGWQMSQFYKEVRLQTAYTDRMRSSPASIGLIEDKLMMARRLRSVFPQFQGQDYSDLNISIHHDKQCSLFVKLVTVGGGKRFLVMEVFSPKKGNGIVRFGIVPGYMMFKEEPQTAT